MILSYLLGGGCTCLPLTLLKSDAETPSSVRELCVPLRRVLQSAYPVKGCARARARVRAWLCASE